MLKRLIQKLYKKKALNKEFVLVGTCIKETEDSYLLYDEVEQALEYIFHWYEHTDMPYGARMVNGGYFPVIKSNIVEIIDFSRYIHTLVEHKVLPVVISNSCESFAECVLDYTSGKVGIINLSQHIDLTSDVNFVPMQAYRNVMAEKADIEMLSLGVYEDMISTAELNIAESMGVRWLNSSAFCLLHAEKLYEELDTFLSENEVIALNIDLRSIVRGMTIRPPFALEFDLVLSILEEIMKSDKVTLVHLTGDNESLIFSGEAKKVLDIIRAKRESVNYAA